MSIATTINTALNKYLKTPAGQTAINDAIQNATAPEKLNAIVSTAVQEKVAPTNITNDFLTNLKTTNTKIVDALKDSSSAAPVYVAGSAAAQASPPNYLLYAGLAIAAFFLFRKR